VSPHDTPKILTLPGNFRTAGRERICWAALVKGSAEVASRDRLVGRRLPCIVFELSSEGVSSMAGTPGVQVRRVYESRRTTDGARVLVDRIWPRGLTKLMADLDEWCKEVAPSTELRKWYRHDPDRFEEFSRRYQVELAVPERADALAHLRDLSRHRALTLLTATKQPQISEAAVLAELLKQ